MQELLRTLVKIALAVATLVFGYSLITKDFGSNPRVIVQELIDEDTSQLDDFDGFVSRREGYDVHVRFRAEPDWSSSLRHYGFSEANCLDVRNHVKFSITRVAAWPPWRPEELTDVVCYERRGENALSPRGRDFLLAEADGGWVYFSGQGREYDRNLPE